MIVRAVGSLLCVCTQMAGFFAALVGELFTGSGAIGQLALETQLPPGVIKATSLHFVYRIEKDLKCHRGSPGSWI